MIPTQVVAVALYEPGEDSHGAPIDAWAEPTPVVVYGWAPAGGVLDNQPIDSNRRPVTIDIEVFAPKSLGGPRARWALPGKGVFEQVGHAADYRDGPWWRGAGVVIGLTRTEG